MRGAVARLVMIEEGKKEGYRVSMVVYILRRIYLIAFLEFGILRLLPRLALLCHPVLGSEALERSRLSWNRAGHPITPPTSSYRSRLSPLLAP